MATSPETILGTKVADLSRDGSRFGELGNEKLDAIVSTLVLEHLPFDCYKRTLEKCARLLVPGGWLMAVEGFSEEGIDTQEWFFEEMEACRTEIDPTVSDSVAKLRNELETHYYTSKKRKQAGGEIMDSAALQSSGSTFALLSWLGESLSDTSK